MKILTVSASPYLLVRNGRMNAAVIEKLVDERHEVSTAAWHHDELFFLPEEEGVHWFEKDERRLAKIYPVEPHVQGSSALYELMKVVQPDIVITIGDYKETDFIWEIKAMVPNLFKWVAVMTVDCLPINENHKQQIEYADAVMSISDYGDEALRSFLNAEITKEYFGPSEVFFADSEIERQISFMTSAKNAQASNLGAFIKAMGKNPEIEGYLHTNLYDPGDYDIDLLIDRYGASNVALPSHFVSVKESISDEELRDIYALHTFYVETSVKSASALSMLEAMASGCIPIGMAAGRAGELLSEFSNSSRLIVPHETYIGANEEEFSVISIEGLSARMSELEEWAQREPKALQNLSDEARQIAASYRQKTFTQKLSSMVSNIRSAPLTVAVDCF
jgi:glycosyltransferase involved in cell wall biosynthesis